MKIKRLEIKTGNLKAQLEFYREVMGLETRYENENSFEVKIGYSELKFTFSKNYTPYHIAIHIPPLHAETALAWLDDRLNVLKNGYEEIVDFSAWNARSVYFYDADRNIMEFISRRHLFEPQEEGFSEKSMIGIAEIGLPTASIPKKFELLKNHFRLEKFDGDFEVFCAIGDELGLLITIDRYNKEWFPTNDKAYSSEFEIEFSHQNGNFGFSFQDDNLEVKTELS